MVKFLIPFVAAIAAVATPVAGATLIFDGAYQHQNPPASPGGRCGPALTVSFGPAIAPATGTSNLGSFAPSGSHCIVPPLPTDYTAGAFSFDFGAGDVLLGTYAGTLSATPSPGQFSNLQSYVVTGGTGRFAAATGSFTGTGLVTFAPGLLPSSDQRLSGCIVTAAVPNRRRGRCLSAALALSAPPPGASVRRLPLEAVQTSWRVDASTHSQLSRSSRGIEGFRPEVGSMPGR